MNMLEELNHDLRDRGESYGKFGQQSCLAQDLKAVMLERLENNPAFQKLNEEQRNTIREGLEMILLKVSRLANGDPTHWDSYKDIAGYAIITARDIQPGALG